MDEKHLEYAKKYRLKYPERCKEAIRRWRENNPEKIKEQNRKKRFNRGIAARKWRYGITKEQFDTILKNQNNKCAICGINLQRPHIDHNHKTGQIRGIVCFHCNTGLGMFRDNQELLLKAFEYLRGWGMK